MRYAKTFFAALTLALVAAAFQSAPAEDPSTSAICRPDGSCEVYYFPDGTVVI